MLHYVIVCFELERHVLYRRNSKRMSAYMYLTFYPPSMSVNISHPQFYPIHSPVLNARAPVAIIRKCGLPATADSFRLTAP